MVRRAVLPPTRAGALSAYETNLTILESSAFVNNSAGGFGGRRRLEMLDCRGNEGRALLTVGGRLLFFYSPVVPTPTERRGAHSPCLVDGLAKDSSEGPESQ